MVKKNLTGDVVSIKKEGKEVVITKETQTNDLDYADINSKDPQKPDMIKTGTEESHLVWRFPSKTKALEHFEVQLNNCKKGMEVFADGMKDLQNDIMDAKIFEQITKIIPKLDKNMYKGKYKSLETYLEKHAQYKHAKSQVDIRGEHVPYFETILKTIKKLK